MANRLILDTALLDVIISRLCHQVLENHPQLTNTIILGIQPRGIFLAERLKKKLKSIQNVDVPVGHLDVTFHRDDFRRRDTPIQANETHIPFLIEDKDVILVDDVLYTGRTVRAALDAMIAYGRPRKVELLALIDRKYTRDLPIYPNYVGKHVNTLKTQKVLVEWQEQGKESDNIWLVDKASV